MTQVSQLLAYLEERMRVGRKELQGFPRCIQRHVVVPGFLISLDQEVPHFGTVRLYLDCLAKRPYRILEVAALEVLVAQQRQYLKIPGPRLSGCVKPLDGFPVPVLVRV